MFEFLAVVVFGSKGSLASACLSVSWWQGVSQE